MSGGPTVTVVQTSTANLAAVVAGFRRLDCDVVLSRDPVEVAGADRVVLPGVGAFGAARSALARAGLEDSLKRRVEDGRATLAICLGLQLLAEGSEESPGVAGLGLFAGHASRFDGEGLRVPQIGWNPITSADDCLIVDPGHVYFANSYRLEQAPKGWSVAWCDYGGPFVAAVERGSVVGCQFHPELSGAYGRRLMRSWLEMESEPC